jgi:hypothetical protein
MDTNALIGCLEDLYAAVTGSNSLAMRRGR